MLYSVYSVPNIVLPLIGGVFLDKVGLTNGLIITMTLVTAG